MKLRQAVLAIMALSILVVGPILYAVLRWWGIPPSQALLAVGLAVASFCAGTLLNANVVTTAYLPPRQRVILAAISYAFPMPIFAIVILRSLLNAPLWFSIIIAVSAFSLQAWRLTRTLQQSLEPRWTLPVEWRNAQDADRAIPDLRARIDAAIEHEQRSSLEINLATALMARSQLTMAPEGLDEALTLLVANAGRGDIPRVTIFWAVNSLVQAWDLQATRSGDDAGYEPAINLLRRVASDAAPEDRDWQQRLVHVAEVQLCSWQLKQALAPPGRDTALIESLVERGRRAAQQGLQLCSPGTHPEFHLRQLLASMIGLIDPRSAADDLRELLRGRGWQDRKQRAFARLALAQLLLQAEDVPAQSYRAQLREADRLCQDLISYPGEARAVGAYHRALIRAAYGDRFDSSPAGDMWPASYFRAAVEQAEQSSSLSASEYARDWADWAVAVGDADEAAEAYWRLVNNTSRELEFRYVPEAARQLVSAAQGTAAEAGYWLGRASRPVEGVVAIEQARTLLLGQRVGRASPAVHRALVALGREDLWADYRAAGVRLESAERRHQRTGTAAATGADATAIQLAWSNFRREEHEVMTALGRVDDPVRATFQDIATVADGATTVYLAAADTGGCAYSVDGTGRLEYVRLPELTANAINRLGLEMGRLTTGPAGASPRDPWDRLLTELGRIAIQPLLPALPPDPTVTLVPTGGIGLLPLHAALVARPGTDTLCPVVDLMSIRYAPSSRLLRRNAESPSPADDRILVADVATAVAGRSALPGASRETDAIKSIYGARCLLIHEARREQVRRRMRETQVWHLACHAHADLKSPLQSALHLSDGSLTLREFLDLRREARRLVVLSACETAIPDQSMLDEMISFPSALLAAGVEAIVATGWNVDSDVAVAMTVRFHRLRESGRSTTEAFTAAQRWLRTASARDLHALLPDTFHPPAYLPVDAQEAWLARPEIFAHPALWASFSLTGG